VSGDDLDFASTNPRPVFPQDYYEARARAAQADDLPRALAASIDDAAALRRALAQEAGHPCLPVATPHRRRHPAPFPVRFPAASRRA
jgi:hypothetical protein